MCIENREVHPSLTLNRIRKGGSLFLQSSVVAESVTALIAKSVVNTGRILTLVWHDACCFQERAVMFMRYLAAVSVTRNSSETSSSKKSRKLTCWKNEAEILNL